MPRRSRHPESVRCLAVDVSFIGRHGRTSQNCPLQPTFSLRSQPRTQETAIVQGFFRSLLTHQLQAPVSFPMSQPTTIDCIFEHILGFMLPFFLIAAGGDKTLARA